MIRQLIATCFIVSTSVSALADIEVIFREGAPKDRFTIRNTGSCDLQQATILIDLSASAAGLVFDTTSAGAGVEVFQPLEITDGKQYLTQIPQVVDGDQSVALEVNDFSTDSVISFTIDVDDTIGQREITVSNSEISGAQIRLEGEGTMLQANFGPSARAEIADSVCT